jgi:hypothetical protein
MQCNTDAPLSDSQSTGIVVLCKAGSIRASAIAIITCEYIGPAHVDFTKLWLGCRCQSQQWQVDQFHFVHGAWQAGIVSVITGTDADFHTNIGLNNLAAETTTQCNPQSVSQSVSQSTNQPATDSPDCMWYAYCFLQVPVLIGSTSQEGNLFSFIMANRSLSMSLDQYNAANDLYMAPHGLGLAGTTWYSSLYQVRAAGCQRATTMCAH